MTTNSDDPDFDDAVGTVGTGRATGDPRWWGGSLAVIKASSENTAGRLVVIDNYAREGAAPPVHIHHNEGEGFYLLEGTMTIWIGGETIEASVGSFAYGPPGVPHTFLVTSPIARYLFITEPAGFDHFVRDVSVPAETVNLPSAGGSELDPDDMTAAAARYGIEILGPPGIPSPGSQYRSARR